MGSAVDGYNSKDGYAVARDSRPSYFDAKREIKKIYNLGVNAIARKDEKYINFLLLKLNELKGELKEKYKLNTHGSYVLRKDIDSLRFLFLTKLKKKIAEDAAHEKKSRRSTQPRN